MKEVTLNKLRQLRCDKVILFLVVFLSIISILLVYSTEGKRVINHLIHLAFSFGFMGIAYVFNLKKWMSSLSFLVLLIAIGLLIITLCSSAVRGITFFGVTLQTFYLIGFSIIFFFANYIGRRLDAGAEQLSPEGHVYTAIILFLFCGGIAMLNMSTSIILFATGMVMFFIGNFRWKTIFRILGIVVIGVVGLTLLVKFDMMGSFGRMDTFINRWEYYLYEENINGYGDQMILSRAAIARSGLHPTGPGKGIIKNRLPENSTDYAYASLFEETGIFIGLIIIACYIMFFYRSWQIARESKTATGALLSFGIGFWLTFQALVHIGVNCNLLPATGQTLPFISTGGMSLAVSGLAVGFLLNVSKNNYLDSQKADPRTMYVQGDLRRN